LPGRSSQRDNSDQPGFVADDGNYAGAGFVLRCAADEAWWAILGSNQ